MNRLLSDPAYRRPRGPRRGLERIVLVAYAGLLGLGVLCLVLMGPEKIIADEVAHETEGAWSLQGEYVMLYGMLVLQLIYSLLVGRRLLPAGETRGGT